MGRKRASAIGKSLSTSAAAASSAEDRGGRLQVASARRRRREVARRVEMIGQQSPSVGRAGLELHRTAERRDGLVQMTCLRARDSEF